MYVTRPTGRLQSYTAGSLESLGKVSGASLLLSGGDVRPSCSGYVRTCITHANDLADLKELADCLPVMSQGHERLIN